MDKKAVLNFIYGRLTEMHGENPNVDYMQNLKRIADEVDSGEVEQLKRNQEKDNRLLFTFMELLESIPVTDAIKEMSQKIFPEQAEHYKEKYALFKKVQQEQNSKRLEISYCRGEALGGHCAYGKSGNTCEKDCEIKK